MAQTQYVPPGLAFAGELMESRLAFVDSVVNENASPLPFGIAVKRGAAFNGIDNMGAATDELSGITIQSHTFDPKDLTGTQGIPAASQNLGPPATGILKLGAICIRTEQSMNPGDPVFVRFAPNGGNTQLGAFRKDIDSGNARRVKGLYIYKNISATLAWARWNHWTEISKQDYNDSEFVIPSAAATATQHLGRTRADSFFVVTGVDYIEPATGIAQSDTNFYIFTLQFGATIAATLSTKVTGGIAVPANTYVAFTVSGTLANTVIPPGTVMDLVSTLTGTLTAPAGTLVVHGFYI